MAATPRPDWAEVLQHIKAFFPAVAIVAAMRLDLFTPLAEGPKTPEALAERLGVPVRRLRMLLHSLASTGLVMADGERFANSPVADEFLVRGRPRYMGGSHELYADMFATVLSTADSVRAGAPTALHDWAHMPEEQLRALLRGLNPGATAAGRMLAEQRDFGRVKSLLDVGGGGGGLAIGICQASPGITARVIELPRVAAVCEDLVAAGGLASRIRAIAHDIIESPLADVGDAAILRNFVQVLPPDSARRALDNIGRSVRPEGEIFIIGVILDDDRTGPPGALALNLFFLNAFPEGEAYTESQYREWLEGAGFTDIRRSPFPGLDHSLMTGRKRA